MTANVSCGSSGSISLGAMPRGASSAIPTAPIDPLSKPGGTQSPETLR